jgi:hypothetical protein
MLSMFACSKHLWKLSQQPPLGAPQSFASNRRSLLRPLRFEHARHYIFLSVSKLIHICC